MMLNEGDVIEITIENLSGSLDITIADLNVDVIKVLSDTALSD